MPRRPHIFACLTLGIVLTLMLLEGGSWAAPPIPVEPGRSEPATLQYRYAIGRADRFSIQFELRATNTSLVLPINQEVSYLGAVTFRQVIQNRDGEGNSFVYQELSDLQVTGTENEEPIALEDSVGSMTGVFRRMKLDPSGHVLDQEVTPIGSLPALLPNLPTLRDILEWMRIELPSHPVGISDSWVQQYGYSFVGQDDPLNFDLSAELTFLGYARVGERTCAVIQSNLELVVTIEPERAFETAEEILGRGTGVGYYYFDIAAGRIRLGQVDFGLVMQTNVPNNPIDFTARAALRFEATP